MPNGDSSAAWRDGCDSPTCWCGHRRSRVTPTTARSRPSPDGSAPHAAGPTERSETATIRSTSSSTGWRSSGFRWRLSGSATSTHRRPRWYAGGLARESGQRLLKSSARLPPVCGGLGRQSPYFCSLCRVEDQSGQEVPSPRLADAIVHAGSRNERTTRLVESLQIDENDLWMVFAGEGTSVACDNE